MTKVVEIFIVRPTVGSSKYTDDACHFAAHADDVEGRGGRGVSADHTIRANRFELPLMRSLQVLGGSQEQR